MSLLGCSSQRPRAGRVCRHPWRVQSGLPTIDGDVKVELRVGALDEGLQGPRGVAALASQDVHHRPHLLGQGARLLRLARLLCCEEVQPPQVADDLLQELR